MKTVRLEESTLTLADLLALAREEAILVVSEEGRRFILEEEDEFDEESAKLGESERFGQFLQQRAAEPGSVSIDQFAERLDSGEGE